MISSIWDLDTNYNIEPKVTGHYLVSYFLQPKCNQEGVLNYQETTKHTRATFQLELRGWVVLLQQIQPVEAFSMTWATISAAAAVKPRAIAGLRGYTHWVVDRNWTWEPCRIDRIKINNNNSSIIIIEAIHKKPTNSASFSKLAL